MLQLHLVVWGDREDSGGAYCERKEGKGKHMNADQEPCMQPFTIPRGHAGKLMQITWDGARGGQGWGVEVSGFARGQGASGG